jgi:DNA-binding MarR family transcriptional regulator
MGVPAEVVVPALLRASRGAYANAIRDRLAAAGFDDMPKNGPYVIGGMANRNATAGQLVQQLGITKQATSQLLDTLVLRGYVDRSVDPDDRRRQTLELTERGRDAGVAIRAGVDSVDDELVAILSPAEMVAFCRGLEALCEIRERHEAQ